MRDVCMVGSLFVVRGEAVLRLGGGRWLKGIYG